MIEVRFMRILRTASLALLTLTISHAQLPWGTVATKDDQTVFVLLPQTAPTVVPVAVIGTKSPKQGVMITVLKARELHDSADNVRVTVDAVFALESGSIAFQQKWIDFDQKYPTTMFFDVGKVKSVLAVKVKFESTHELKTNSTESF